MPFEGGYRAWRSAVAEGWRVPDAADRERARLHGGGVTVGATVRTGAAAPRTTPKADRRGRATATAVEPAGGASGATGSGAAGSGATGSGATGRLAPRLSKDTYRRRKGAVEADLERLGRRRAELEAAMADPEVQSNFVELRRLSNELAEVDEALAAAEEAWLIVEEQAP